VEEERTGGELLWALTTATMDPPKTKDTVTNTRDASCRSEPGDSDDLLFVCVLILINCLPILCDNLLKTQKLSVSGMNRILYTVILRSSSSIFDFCQRWHDDDDG
jgi:hypothetical protein